MLMDITIDWATQPHNVKNDKFLEKLICEGQYSSGDLDLTDYGGESIKSVLSRR
jgi:hypothetical protein